MEFAVKNMTTGKVVFTGEKEACLERLKSIWLSVDHYDMRDVYSEIEYDKVSIKYKFALTKYEFRLIEVDHK